MAGNYPQQPYGQQPPMRQQGMYQQPGYGPPGGRPPMRKKKGGSANVVIWVVSSIITAVCVGFAIHFVVQASDARNEAQDVPADDTTAFRLLMGGRFEDAAFLNSTLAKHVTDSDRAVIGAAQAVMIPQRDKKVVEPRDFDYYTGEVARKYSNILDKHEAIKSLSARIKSMLEKRRSDVDSTYDESYVEAYELISEVKLMQMDGEIGHPKIKEYIEQQLAKYNQELSARIGTHGDLKLQKAVQRLRKATDSPLGKRFKIAEATWGYVNNRDDYQNFDALREGAPEFHVVLAPIYPQWAQNIVNSYNQENSRYVGEVHSIAEETYGKARSVYEEEKNRVNSAVDAYIAAREPFVVALEGIVDRAQKRETPSIIKQIKEAREQIEIARKLRYAS